LLKESGYLCGKPVRKIKSEKVGKDLIKKNDVPEYSVGSIVWQ
jgi:hypothetical protein